jgi:translation initiation factor 4E
MASALLNAPSNKSGLPSSPVPLDTIPVSPAGELGDENAPPKKEYKESEQVTVFHDPENFNVKHPLMNNWTLWFTKPPSGKVCILNKER